MSCKDYEEEFSKLKQERINILTIAIKNIFCLTYLQDSVFHNRKREKLKNKMTDYKRSYKR
jgi:hypothetical protein